MKNISKPRFFQCYLDNEHMLSHLNDKQAGMLWKALFSYANHDEELSFSDPLVSMAYTTMKAQIDRDFMKYHQKCEKNRENIKKRYIKCDTEYDGIPSNTNEYERYQEEEKEEEKEEYKEKEKDNDKEKEKENASSYSLRIDAVDKYKIELIINSLNKSTGADFNPRDSATQRLIAKRLNEGYKLNDFFSVIEHKCRELATDSEKRSYLCPKTLFSDNFKIYLDEAENRATTKHSENYAHSD